MATILSQYWKACTKVMPFMPPLAIPSVTMAPSTTTPIQYRPAHGDLQGDPGPLELGEQVEAADQDHGGGGRPAQAGEPSRPSAKSGMV